MRKLRFACISIMIMWKGAFAFEIDPFPKGAPLLEIFSTNCLQMTQSQQMLKAYVMIGLHSNFRNPKKDLSRAIIDYDQRMYKVKAYFDSKLGTNEKGKKAFAEALELWKKSKLMLEMEPTKENALKIKKNFLTMINKLLAGTKPLATPDLELISLTGKLCRKPFEVTIDYLMRIWGVNIENYDRDVKKIMHNFHENLKILSANKLNNEQSQKLLKKSEREFKFFEFMYNSKTKFIPSLLSQKADDNFIIIRNIKKIFKKQAQKL